MASLPGPPLDHLILLVPSLTSASTAFVTSNGFQLIPGGAHADGLTENALIVLPDGVYIELIAFTPNTTPEDRANHWWGKKKDGWIDWALGSSWYSASAGRVDEANASAGRKIFEDAVDGGRITKEGKELKWKVAFPVPEVGQERGARPFLCEDVTERGWRVPAQATPHPNGATGVRSMTLLARPGDIMSYIELLLPILTTSSHYQRGRVMENRYELSTPTGGVLYIFVREAVGDDEIAWVQERGPGLWEVEIATERGEETLKFGAEAGARFVVGS